MQMVSLVKTTFALSLRNQPEVQQEKPRRACHANGCQKLWALYVAHTLFKEKDDYFCQRPGQGRYTPPPSI